MRVRARVSIGSRGILRLGVFLRIRIIESQGILRIEAVYHERQGQGIIDPASQYTMPLILTISLCGIPGTPVRDTLRPL